MDKRVKFDFEIDFSNGGGIQGQDFRLDIDGDTIADAALADYIVRDMRLLMVESVCILNKAIIEEPHKRTNGLSGRISGIVDLSHIIEDGLVTYKGLPAPIICDYLSREDSRKFYEEGTSFQIGKIEMVTNTGTYLDCPFHRYADGKDLSEVGLEAFVDLPGVVVRAPHAAGLAVDEKAFDGIDVRGKAVLVHTGWGDDHWNTETYYENHPFLTEAAAVYLRDNGARLVGIDSHNIDDTHGRARPVHSVLLRAEVLVCEHLCNLGAVPDAGFSFTAAPPKFKGVGTFPVRAFARVGEG
ncbi:MAG: cyclase family protein [Anaerolineae bacterium]|nr:cyclase family protein [Anaerolineae bacterium]